MNLTIPINFHKTDFAQLSLIGQFNKGFIIAKKNNSLFIIDQHAADEKYLFETFQEVTEIHKQPLIIPKQLKLTSDEEVLLYNNLESFSANGFAMMKMLRLATSFRFLRFRYRKKLCLMWGILKK